MSYGLFLTDASPGFSSFHFASLPSVAVFATVQHDFLTSLAPHKRGRALIDIPTYAAIRAVLLDVDLASNSEFCTWARKTFHLDDAERHILHKGGKRVARTDHLHEILCAAHISCAHGGRNTTLKEVKMHWRFVPKDIVARFVKACPTCTQKNAPHRAAEHLDVQRTPVRPSFPVPVPVSVPRLLIFPASEICPPADRPRSPDRPLNVPLGSPTTELLTGFTPPRRTMRVPPPSHISDSSESSSRPNTTSLRHKSWERSAGSDSPKSFISSDPALPLHSFPPPLTPPLVLPSRQSPILVDATPTSDPPPRPPRSPLRPPATPISPTATPVSRANVPGPIDVRAANSRRLLLCDVDIEAEDVATPALDNAYGSTSTPSEISLPLTPSDLNGTDIGYYTRPEYGDSAAYIAGDEKRALRGVTPRVEPGSGCTTITRANNKSDAPPSPRSVASLWSQDSAEGEYDGDAEGEANQSFLR